MKRESPLPDKPKSRYASGPEPSFFTGTTLTCGSLLTSEAKLVSLTLAIPHNVAVPTGPVGTQNH